MLFYVETADDRFWALQEPAPEEKLEQGLLDENIGRLNALSLRGSSSKLPVEPLMIEGCYGGIESIDSDDEASPVAEQELLQEDLSVVAGFRCLAVHARAHDRVALLFGDSGTFFKSSAPDISIFAVRIWRDFQIEEGMLLGLSGRNHGLLLITESLVKALAVVGVSGLTVGRNLFEVPSSSESSSVTTTAPSGTRITTHSLSRCSVTSREVTAILWWRAMMLEQVRLPVATRRSNNRSALLAQLAVGLTATVLLAYLTLTAAAGYLGSSSCIPDYCIFPAWFWIPFIMADLALLVLTLFYFKYVRRHKSRIAAGTLATLLAFGVVTVTVFLAVARL